ncbi:stage II sporulation protein E [Kouleothrix aurantiaca]|uniref:Stage II sporulation protein E n=1 Tax=Kouleothrix aurantiaca TaxID=186479 RepID=A0A0P9DLF0_9CHLR|nr:stage II sporulation protein E [Kouleothrix aurantiaca]
MSSSWGAVCRAKQGQTVSGDMYFVQEYAEGKLIASVIDGLGGGVEAARAAQLALNTLQKHPDMPLQELIRQAHTALHNTRGAVIGVVRLDIAQAQASYIGVGNIGVQVYSRQPIKPISKNGILGFRLPTLLELHYTYDPGDLFVLYSDGISQHFAQDTSISIRQPPQTMADSILAGYGKTSDDATVLVIKTSEHA